MVTLLLFGPVRGVLVHSWCWFLFLMWNCVLFFWGKWLAGVMNQLDAWSDLMSWNPEAYFFSDLPIYLPFSTSLYQEVLLGHCLIGLMFYHLSADAMHVCTPLLSTAARRSVGTPTRWESISFTCVHPITLFVIYHDRSLYIDYHLSCSLVLVDVNAVHACF